MLASESAEGQGVELPQAIKLGLENFQGNFV